MNYTLLSLKNGMIRTIHMRHIAPWIPFSHFHRNYSFARTVATRFTIADRQSLPPHPSATLVSRFIKHRTHLIPSNLYVTTSITRFSTSTASSVTDIHGERFFEDSDGSSVRILSRECGYSTYNVVAPMINNQSGELLVHYFYEPFPAAVTTLESVIRAMLGSATSEHAVFGLDSETGLLGNIDLLQISSVDTCVLIHRKSTLFQSDVLRKFFSNTLDGYTNKAIFCGAELAGDALGMLSINKDMSFPLELHGALDFTPFYTNMLSTNSSELDVSLAFNLVKPPTVPKSIGLRAAFKKIFKTNWNKVNSISCSDWSNAGLVLEQVKYGVLDAWVSYKLGLFALNLLKSRGIYDSLFSTIPLSYRSQLLPLFQQSKLLDDSKKPKPIHISNMQVKNDRIIDIHCIQYANHIRGGSKLSKVLIKLYSPGGSKEGIELIATAVKSKGKVSTVELERYIKPLNTFNTADWKTYALLLQSDDENTFKSAQSGGIAREIVRLWAVEDELCGHYTKRENRSESSKFVRVRVYYDDKDRDIQLAQVSDFIKFIVRSHYWKTSCQTFDVIKSFGNALGMSLLLDGNLSENTAITPLSNEGRECMRSHEQSMTPAQYQALRNSFEHKISVIQGPAGTGKTRVIAAIADVATSMNKRVLVIAPGNAASRRILESICSTGFKEACLIAAEKFFLEWHEHSYHKSIGQFVYTKDQLDEELSSRPDGSGEATAMKRGDYDFRKRKTKKYVGKYDPQVVDSPMPEVVIATHGYIATTLVQGLDTIIGDKRANVKKLFDFGSIEMVIVDESSQLWSGYLLGWFSALKNLQSLVIVGDEKQLPPFGQDQVALMESLLSVAHKATPQVPSTLLDVTWRLPSGIAEFISSNVYDNQLRSERYVDSDAKFYTCLESIVKLINNPVMRELIERFITLSGESGSLVWLNHQFPAHVNKETKSTGNIEEAVVVSMLASSLMKACDAEASSKHLRIVILTPYLEQKIVLEKQLAKDLVGFRGMNPVQLVDWVLSSAIVNTVDSFQGQEAEFVFISLTRSSAPDSEASGLGFAQDSRRANVMLTRVKNMMIVVGDAINMVTGSRGKSGILIPLLAQHASDSDSMFSVSKNTEFISPYKLPLYIPQAIAAKKYHEISTPKHASPARVTTQPRSVSIPIPPTVELTNLWSAARNFARECGGVILLSALGDLIPPEMRPKQYKTLLLPLSKDPLLCITAGEDNRSYYVVLKEVIDKFGDHIVSLLKKTPDSTLTIKDITGRTNRKVLGLPPKNVLSIDSVVSLLSSDVFVKSNGTISLRSLPLPTNELPDSTSEYALIAETRSSIKEYLAYRPQCTASFNEVANFIPSSLRLNLEEVLSDDKRFLIMIGDGTSLSVALTAPCLLSHRIIDLTSLWTAARKHVHNNGGTILFSKLCALIPPAMRPRYKTLLKPLSKDRLLCIAQGTDKQCFVALKKVIDKFREHIVSLLKKTPDSTLPISNIPGRTNRKVLGLPSKDILSIDTVVSLFCADTFVKGSDGTISLRVKGSKIPMVALVEHAV